MMNLGGTIQYGTRHKMAFVWLCFSGGTLNYRMAKLGNIPLPNCSAKHPERLPCFDQCLFLLPFLEGKSVRLICLPLPIPCLQASTPASRNITMQWNKMVCTHIHQRQFFKHKETMHFSITNNKKQGLKRQTISPHPDAHATGDSSSQTKYKEPHPHYTTATPRPPSWNVRWIPSAACDSTPFAIIQCCACRIPPFESRAVFPWCGDVWGCTFVCRGGGFWRVRRVGCGRGGLRSVGGRPRGLLGQRRVMWLCDIRLFHGSDSGIISMINIYWRIWNGLNKSKLTQTKFVTHQYNFPTATAYLHGDLLAISPADFASSFLLHAPATTINMDQRLSIQRMNNEISMMKYISCQPITNALSKSNETKQCYKSGIKICKMHTPVRIFSTNSHPQLDGH